VSPTIKWLLKALLKLSKPLLVWEKECNETEAPLANSVVVINKQTRIKSVLIENACNFKRYFCEY
jgi:hypothetical protein